MLKCLAGAAHSDQSLHSSPKAGWSLGKGGCGSCDGDNRTNFFCCCSVAVSIPLAALELLPSLWAAQRQRVHWRWRRKRRQRSSWFLGRERRNFNYAIWIASSSWSSWESDNVTSLGEARVPLPVTSDNRWRPPLIVNHWFAMKKGSEQSLPESVFSSFFIIVL